LGLLSILQSGCAPTYYVKVSPSIDISSIKSISVWQFPSEPSLQNSSNVVTRAFEEAFTEHGFSVIDNNKLTNVIKSTTGINRGQVLQIKTLSPDVLTRIRTETSADALLVGKIWRFFEPCSPFVSYDSCRLECYFELIDTRSGEIIMEGRLMEEEMTLRAAALSLARKAVGRVKEKLGR